MPFHRFRKRKPVITYINVGTCQFYGAAAFSAAIPAPIRDDDRCCLDDLFGDFSPRFCFVLVWHPAFSVVFWLAFLVIH